MYSPGEPVRLWLKVKHPDTDAYTDPSGVYLYVTNPADVETALAPLVHPSTGKYHFVYTIPDVPASAGTWTWRWETTGSLAGERAGTFYVEADA